MSSKITSPEPGGCTHQPIKGNLTGHLQHLPQEGHQELKIEPIHGLETPKG